MRTVTKTFRVYKSTDDVNSPDCVIRNAAIDREIDALIDAYPDANDISFVGAFGSTKICMLQYDIESTPRQSFFQIFDKVKKLTDEALGKAGGQ